ncbi:hypothetical protein P3T36_004872 [Kitasatospora sp. MAP12-15]|uniref:hypothetical protein n=1 Tax=unclassified Kitasatospora TaxID=2633591 RepID=UPI00247339DD|nr:hypothetical protein [Kitasatospora sp. MAP12-44]MDH6110196.1 hypothetical protein [Kitasatospora sp. MAP12-44]
MTAVPMRVASGGPKWRPLPTQYYYDITSTGGHTIFICDEDRAERRRSVLTRLAVGRRKTVLRRLRGRR